MQSDTLEILAAILCLTLLICWALYLGYDGALLAGVIGIFGYVVGYKHKAARNPAPS